MDPKIYNNDLDDIYSSLSKFYFNQIYYHDQFSTGWFRSLNEKWMIKKPNDIWL